MYIIAYMCIFYSLSHSNGISLYESIPTFKKGRQSRVRYINEMFRLFLLKDFDEQVDLAKLNF